MSKYLNDQSGFYRMLSKTLDLLENLFTDMLKDNYFGRNAIYSPVHFRRRFFMRRSLFEKIPEDLVEANPYFEQKKDALLGSGRFFVTSKVNLSASNAGLKSFDRSSG